MGLSQFTSVLTLLCVTIFITIEAKIFDRTELAHVMHENGLTNISRWLCMTQEMSQHNSSLEYIKQNEAGGFTSGHGIFAIYYPYWCGINENSGGCNINCANLRDDDLRDDIECVKTILNQQGIVAWQYGLDKCKNREMNDLPDYIWDRRHNHNDVIQPSHQESSNVNMINITIYN